MSSSLFWMLQKGRAQKVTHSCHSDMLEVILFKPSMWNQNTTSMFCHSKLATFGKVSVQYIVLRFFLDRNCQQEENQPACPLHPCLSIRAASHQQLPGVRGGCMQEKELYPWGSALGRVDLDKDQGQDPVHIQHSHTSSKHLKSHLTRFSPGQLSVGAGQLIKSTSQLQWHPAAFWHLPLV